MYLQYEQCHFGTRCTSPEVGGHSSRCEPEEEKSQYQVAFFLRKWGVLEVVGAFWTALVSCSWMSSGAGCIAFHCPDKSSIVQGIDKQYLLGLAGEIRNGRLFHYPLPALNPSCQCTDQVNSGMYNYPPSYYRQNFGCPLRNFCFCFCFISFYVLLLHHSNLL